MTETPKAGDKVRFTRGMFGSWKGTVIKCYQTRGRRSNGMGADCPMVLIAYTRRNGSFGKYRSQLIDVRPA